MFDDSDQLLFVVSSRGKMRWQSFKNAFDILLQQAGGRGPRPTDGPKWALLNCVRTLQGLGHCDFDFDRNNEVIVAPPLLARLPRAGLTTAVLTGARTPALVERLLAAAKSRRVRVRVMPPARKTLGVPTSVHLESASRTRLEDLAAELNIRFPPQPPAWSFAQFAGSVSDYLACLDWLPASTPDWARVGYHRSGLRFSGNREGDTYLRLSRNEVNGRWAYGLWNDGKRAAANLDWARFAIASEHSQQLIAYDPKNQVFGVPVATPAPRPLDRALGLCSGHAPLQSFSPELSVGIDEERRLFHAYQGVPRAIADLVAEKLGQALRVAHYKTGEFIDG